MQVDFAIVDEVEIPNGSLKRCGDDKGVGIPRYALEFDACGVQHLGNFLCARLQRVCAEGYGSVFGLRDSFQYRGGGSTVGTGDGVDEKRGERKVPKCRVEFFRLLGVLECAQIECLFYLLFLFFAACHMLSLSHTFLLHGSKGSTSARRGNKN